MAVLSSEEEIQKPKAANCMGEPLGNNQASYGRGISNPVDSQVSPQAISLKEHFQPRILGVGQRTVYNLDIPNAVCLELAFKFD